MDIAQSVEHLIVVQKVARSNRVIHPNETRCLQRFSDVESTGFFVSRNTASTPFPAHRTSSSTKPYIFLYETVPRFTRAITSRSMVTNCDTDRDTEYSRAVCSA